MTKWLLRCTVCGSERVLDVGFNLTAFRGRLYIYCRKCKANREHAVLGYYDDSGRLAPPGDFAGVDIAD
ncbi:MAG: hypothetical protein RXO32_09365 [Thermoproteus sp.]|jgi:ribosomal protein L44E